MNFLEIDLAVKELISLSRELLLLGFFKLLLRSNSNDNELFYSVTLSKSSSWTSLKFTCVLEF